MLTLGYVGEWESTGWRGGGGCPTPAPHNPSPMVLLTWAACVNDMRVYRGRNAGPLCLKSGGRGGGCHAYRVCILCVGGCFLHVRVIFVQCGHGRGVLWASILPSGSTFCVRGGEAEATGMHSGMFTANFFMHSVRRWVTSRLQEAAQVPGHLSGHRGSVC